MNMLNGDFKTKEEGMEELKKGISLRNQMCGALYYEILDDDCHEIAKRLISMGADRSEVMAMLK